MWPKLPMSVTNAKLVFYNYYSLSFFLLYFTHSWKEIIAKQCRVPFTNYSSECVEHKYLVLSVCIALFTNNRVYVWYKSKAWKESKKNYVVT